MQPNYYNYKGHPSPAELSKRPPPSRSSPQGGSQRAFPQQGEFWSQNATARYGSSQLSRRGNTWPENGEHQAPSPQLVPRSSPWQQDHGLKDEDVNSGYYLQDRSDGAGMNAWDMSGLGRAMDDDEQGSSQHGGYGNSGRYEDEQRAVSFHPGPPAIDDRVAGRSYPPPPAEDTQWLRRQSGTRADLRPRDVPSLGLWKNLAASPGGSLSKRHPIPPGLRLIFGLDDALPGARDPRPQSPSSGVVSTSSPNASRRYAFSHQGVWDLMMMMNESRGSLEASSAKQRTNGKIFTLTPPAPIDYYTLCPLQTKFKGTGAIYDSDADIFCFTLGVDGVLQKLNDVFGTNYSLDRTPSLRGVLGQIVHHPRCRYDFGYAYGWIRRGWFCDIDYVGNRLVNFQEIGDRRREKAITDDLITNPRISPRRVWDLYSNRVLPFYVLLGADVPRNLWAISHSWVPDSQLRRVWTSINDYEWPVPLPSDVDLSQIRIELLNLGAEYVWLDVLCLRQEIPPTTLSSHPRRDVVDIWQWREASERTRKEEWRLDVPTIGYIYRCKPSQVVVTYFNGLGRPFRLSAGSLKEEGSAHHWINRVWTMQEATPNWLLGGLTPQPFDERDPGVYGTIELFHRRMNDLLAILPQGQTPPDLFALVSFLRLRHARRENDYISGLGYLLQCPVLPIYDETISAETAWERLVRELDPKFLTDLLFLFPITGADLKARWRPSWEQLMRHPLTPLSTSPVAYLQQDLVHYDPASAVYSNVAYAVERCVFHPTGIAGRLQLQVLIGPRDGGQAKSWSFTVTVSSVTPLLGASPAGAEYAVVAAADLKYWLCGNIISKIGSSWTLQKLGTFVMDDAEDIDMLWHLNPGYADTQVIYA
ncbi:uncharacterized protein PHACADRAFT_260919 [Phanerochaete carnosa HHB-10118-sp]|uniref:Heterokaryon incompatibility domain-containing protein n=1 Tax=Phanerochaete carnosa (strain HHB-10118-sp) TaxID=650164 RepID=K5VM17_PHACS|nr:uncharacterized protein PHACADRAFT_260919 [Phanerochaete carnosa HHB-10118-sp]EKM52478.1 hypothetical protein PHACADRAFT_260919 [Phanerochaete carnosa HHB-10118-sp]